MLVSKKNLFIAGNMFPEEMKRFAHEFLVWSKVTEKKCRIEGGIVTFDIAEMKDPQKEIAVQYKDAVHGACRALFTLDSRLNRTEHVHICERLETFADMEKALETIEAFLAN